MDCRKTDENYTVYLLGCFEPCLNMLRQKDQLRIGKKQIKLVFELNKWDYEGEIDEKGFACGFGTVVHDGETYTGTWLLDRFEGVGVQTKADGVRFEGESKQGTWFGKVTVYWLEGQAQPTQTNKVPTEPKQLPAIGNGIPFTLPRTKLKCTTRLMKISPTTKKKD